MSLLLKYQTLKNIRFRGSGGTVVNPTVIRGCTNPEASNYNPNATEDDGSCIIPPPPNTYERVPAQLWAQSLFNGTPPDLNPAFGKEVFTTYGLGYSTVGRFGTIGSAARFEHRSTDPEVRSEIKINNTKFLTRERKIGFTFYVDANYPDEGVGSRDYMMLFQEHGWDSIPPPRSLFMKGGNLIYKTNWASTYKPTASEVEKTFDLGPMPKGVVTHVVMEIRLDFPSQELGWNGGTGWAKVYMSKMVGGTMVNGVLVGAVKKLVQVVNYKGNVGYNNTNPYDYPKWGIYKRAYLDPDVPTVVHIDEIYFGKGTANIRDVMPDPNLEIVYMT